MNFTKKIRKLIKITPNTAIINGKTIIYDSLTLTELAGKYNIDKFFL